MRQILPIAGAVVGGMFGAPQLGFAIGSLIGNAVDPLEVQGNKLGDAPTQVAAEGGTRAIVYGKGCVRAVVVIERGGRRVVKQRDQSGKGGGPVTVNERALWTYAIGIGEPVAAVLRIWENEKLVYDARPESQIVKDSAEYSKLFRFYDGAEDQLPDPAIEAIYTDPTDAPYYRGTAYLVFPQRDLTDFGEAVPTYRVEVATSVEWTEGPYFAISTAHTTGIIKRSSDLLSWTDCPTGLTVYPQLIAVRNRRLFIMGDGCGRVSDDEGETFQPMVFSPAVSPSLSPSGIWWSEECGYIVVFAAQSNCVYKSMDGVNFTMLSATASSTMYGCAVNGSSILIGVNYGGQVLVSTNAGASFSTQGTGLSNGIRFADYDGSRWVATEHVSNFVVSTVSLASGVWDSAGDALPAVANTYGLSSGDGFNVLVGSSGATAYTTGSATSWSVGYTLPSFISWSVGQTSVARIGDAVYAIGTGGELWRSTGPNEWEHIQDIPGAASYNGIAGFNRASATGNGIVLSTVVEALHDRCGHTASDYDVSSLSDMTDGVVIESTLTGAEAINSIIGTHWADPADYDGKIRYIKRGAPVARTLTIDDLIDEPETWQRNNAIEYPAKVHFFGQIAELAYAQVKATSARYSSDVKVVGEASVSSPETFNTSQRPYEIAAILHKIMWTEAGGEVTWRVTDQHLDLVPTDCVGLSWAGQLWRARITQIEADPGELKLKMMLDRQSAYTANLTAIPIPPPVTPPQTSVVSETALAVMDIPALVDAADDLHIVTAMSGKTDAWAGGTLQRSLDDGASFATVSSSTLNAIMGTLQAPVTAASPHYTDTTNAVEVLLYMDDEIEGISEQAFLSEAGAFALSWDDGGTRRWELMQYRDAELIAPKTYRLTTLHRGRLGTEAAAHPIGATFVLLDSAIQAHPTQSAWIGQDLTHRAVSTGHTPDDADEQTLTYEGNSQREFPVANLLLSRAGTDVTATAIPRHRFGTDVAPLRSANWVGYRWTATDGTSTITRDGTTETETFDLTGWASPVSVTVAQLNRITGAGPTVTEGIA